MLSLDREHSWYAWLSGLLPYFIAPLVLVMSAGFAHAVWIPLHLTTFFLGSVACHGALSAARPTASYASTFYLTIAVGGLLGGIFTALIAPLVFDRVVEYPLVVDSGLSGCTMGPRRASTRRVARAWLVELLLAWRRVLFDGDSGDQPGRDWPSRCLACSG